MYPAPAVIAPAVVGLEIYRPVEAVQGFILPVPGIVEVAQGYPGILVVGQHLQGLLHVLLGLLMHPADHVLVVAQVVQALRGVSPGQVAPVLLFRIEHLRGFVEKFGGFLEISSVAGFQTGGEEVHGSGISVYLATVLLGLGVSQEIRPAKVLHGSFIHAQLHPAQGPGVEKVTGKRIALYSRIQDLQSFVRPSGHGVEISQSCGVEAVLGVECHCFTYVLLGSIILGVVVEVPASLHVA